eukprot:maker-scaffold8184_size2827-snap-gene-0.0 protein:Tk04098 transcript:maker-scaffold8184_size2827-snap-gene-0.0-mRNA-1 annotation:"1-pyrroline-5-carboxylate dehydrogenase"
MWNEVKAHIKADVDSFKMGTVDDFGNFINAVIDERSFDKLAGFIDRAKADGQEILCGGNYDKSKGYFIEPTVIVANDPKYVTMCEELFGPVLTVYVYDESKWTETLKIMDESSDYALTGSVFSNDRYALAEANEILKNAAGNFYINDKPTGAVVGQQPFGGARASGTNDKAEANEILKNAAGNFYINDKPTGAVVGQQPFGGARASGTNDKAGSKWNLIRWVNMRTIKETFNPPKDYRYPFL